MEEALVMYSDIFGICRITGLNVYELQERGISAYGAETDFGFATHLDLDKAEDVSSSYEMVMLKSNPVYIMYAELKRDGRVIKHMQLDKTHFYTVLKK